MSSTGQKIWAFIKAQGAFFAHLFLDDPLYPKIKAFGTAPRWHKARLGLGITLAVAMLAVLIVPNTAWALSLSGACAAVLLAVAGALARILNYAGTAFNYVIVAKADPGNPFQYIIGTQAVKIGWTAVRDVCNLGFILILLGIGFATILRVPAYHIKKLILPFIVALLLINFSKLICGVITDFCHVLMASFAAAMTGGDNYSGAIAQAVGVGSWANPPDVTESGGWELVETYFIMCVFMVALIFAFLLIIVLLVVRWITLIVLTIFSPIAYAARILPTTQTMAKKWWTQFLQNAFYGPVAVFMVYLALTIVTYSMGDLATKAAANGSQKLSAEGLLSLIVACILLYKAVTMSRSMGIAGANAVISTGTKWGKKALGGAASLTGKGLAGAAGWAGSRAWDRAKRTGAGTAVSKGISNVRAGIARTRLGKAKLDQSRAEAEKKAAKDFSTAGMNEADLVKMGKKGTAGQRVVALAELAKRGKSDDIDKAMGLDPTDPQQKGRGWAKANTFMAQYASGQEAATFKDAWKKTDPYKASTGTPQEREDKTKRHLQSKGAKEISAKSLEDAEMARITAASVSTSSLRDMTDEQKEGMKKGLRTAQSADPAQRLAIDRAKAVVHGDLSAVDPARRADVLKSMSVEDVANLNMTTMDRGQKVSLATYFKDHPASLAGVQRKNPEMTQAYVGEFSTAQQAVQQQMSGPQQAMATIQQQAQQAAQVSMNTQRGQMENDYRSLVAAGDQAGARIKEREMDRLEAKGPVVQYSAAQQSALSQHQATLAPLEQELKKYDKVLSNPMLGATGP